MGDAFIFTCMAVIISEEIASVLLRLVYPKSQRQVALRSYEFPPGFSSGKSLKGPGWLQAKSLHLQTTPWEPVCRSWTLVMGDADKRWTGRNSSHKHDGADTYGGFSMGSRS